MMPKRKSKKTRRRKTKAVLIILVVLLIVAIGVYIKRFDIVQWGLSRPNIKEKIKVEIKNSFMGAIAPKLRKEIKLTFLQKAGVFVTGKRNEEQREGDAIKAVDRFIMKQLDEDKLGIMVVGKIKRIDQDVYKRYEKLLSKYFIAIVWKYNEGNYDVVAAFNISLRNWGSITEKKVNENAKFIRRVTEVAGNAARGD